MDHRDGVSGPFYCRETYYRKRENKMNYKLIAQIQVCRGLISGLCTTGAGVKLPLSRMLQKVAVHFKTEVLPISSVMLI